MNPILNKILACSDLPSLPAVALRVIELTSDVDVSLKELSRTIENDQGLSVKILKTVNSSFYGLRKRCGTIDKALVMLGLSPVKSLALGFSLVSSIDDPAEAGQFDYMAYWRRGLYSGIAGKITAEHVGFEFGDEVFLGGLLQDIGMIAMYRALGEQYLEVLKNTDNNHRGLVKQELQLLDLQHPDVGAMLVQRWKLPEELSMQVKYHERPTATPSSCADHVRCVGLGNFVHDILTDEEPSAPLQSLYEKAKSWYDITPSAVDEIVEKASEAAREMGSLFNLDIGPYTDANAILAEAAKRSLAIIKESPSDTSVMSHTQEGSVLQGSDSDSLTGTLGPRGLDIAIREGFRLATENDEKLAIVQVVIDNFDSLNTEHGDAADVEAAMGVAGLLKQVFEGHGGVICRAAPNTFAIVLSGMGRLFATNLAEQFAKDLALAAKVWTAPATDKPLRIFASIGIAALESDTRHIFTQPAKLVIASSKAIKAAQDAGSGNMRVFQPKSTAA